MNNITKDPNVNTFRDARNTIDKALVDIGSVIVTMRGTIAAQAADIAEGDKAIDRLTDEGVKKNERIAAYDGITPRQAKAYRDILETLDLHVKERDAEIERLEKALEAAKEGAPPSAAEAEMNAYYDGLRTARGNIDKMLERLKRKESDLSNKLSGMRYQLDKWRDKCGQPELALSSPRTWQLARWHRVVTGALNRIKDGHASLAEQLLVTLADEIKDRIALNPQNKTEEG
jgi:uncharacterized coiled-coil DUF342 family protein